MKWLMALFAAAIAAPAAWANDPETARTPNRVPVTRPDMKVAIEALKDRSPRIPTPAITAEEAAALGDRADRFEARLRLRYLQHEPQRAPGPRIDDPSMSLTYEFKTMMFWIVARMNNCHY